MKTLSIVVLGLLMLTGDSFSAEPAPVPGAIHFSNADVSQVLAIYQQMAGRELIADSRVKTVHHSITLQPKGNASQEEVLKLIEKVLLQQAGIVITRLDEKRTSVTCNDALPILPGVAAQAEPARTNNASGTLQGNAEEIHARLAAFLKTHDYLFLLDAARIADHLYPEPWPREMTGQAEQMLRLRIEVITALNSAIDRAFDPQAPENTVFANVAPPVMPTNPPGPTASGMDPAAIADPVARKAYEDELEKNRRKAAKLNREHSLKIALDSCVNSTWTFLLNLRQDSPAYRAGIQIVEATVKDTNVVRQLKRPN